MMNTSVRKLVAMKLGMLLFLALACSACGPTTTVVLLPEQGKPGGAVVLTAQDKSTVLDKPYLAAKVSSGSAPSAPEKRDEAQVKVEFGKALAAEPPRVANFILYFKLGGTELTDAAKALLPKVFQTIKERKSFFISVVGHTDTLGDAEWNRKLSLRRAQMVAKMLYDKGVPESSVRVTSHGEANLLIPTKDETPEPRNRRVEVTVR